MSKPTITYHRRTYTVLFPDLLRPLGAAEVEDLTASIRKNGVLVPVVVDEDNGIVDGINRLTIASELEAPGAVPFDIRKSLSTKAKRDLALSLNLHRRHLTGDELRRLRQERVQRVAAGRLLTDALAQWFLRRHEAGRRPWQAVGRLLEAPSPDRAFVSWVDRLRDGGGLRNDDVTLVAIDL
jgi:hypothetical protein